KIPKPGISEVGSQSRGTIWQETRFGFQYICKRPSLYSLAALFMVANIFLAIGATLMAPKVLIETGNNASALATVQSVGALGGVIGGTVLSLWGGPRRRIHGVLAGGISVCLLGVAWLGWSRTLAFLAIGSFFFSFFEPLIEGNNLSIWQSKVEADVQGRVFSARQLLVQLPYLFGTLLAGYLADTSAIARILILAGIGGALVFLFGYLSSNVRDSEILLPDAAELL
ncbi:MAG TPA: MFS transporter, partial [Anaerolineales bacterium]|nr:MFS transporter [Anaerolineales bacterium]